MYRVDGETLRRTARCPYEFRCLDLCSCDPCPVRRRMNPTGLVLRDCRHPGCPYFADASDELVCTCPTRVEIFERYEV